MKDWCKFARKLANKAHTPEELERLLPYCDRIPKCAQEAARVCHGSSEPGCSKKELAEEEEAYRHMVLQYPSLHLPYNTLPFGPRR